MELHARLLNELDEGNARISTCFLYVPAFFLLFLHGRAWPLFQGRLSVGYTFIDWNERKGEKEAIIQFQGGRYIQ